VSRRFHDDGHGHVLRVVRTRRGVRLHIDDLVRGVNANIVLRPDDVAWLVRRVALLDGGKLAQKSRRAP